jgi:hypothetical protein
MVYPYSNAPEIAVIYTALGDRDQAMTWLETARAAGRGRTPRCCFY